MWTFSSRLLKNLFRLQDGPWHSISRSASLLSAGLAVVLLSSCIKADKKSADQLKADEAVSGGAATFLITPVEEVSSDELDHDPLYDVPTSRKYRFKVCLKDRVTRDVLGGQKIEILDADGATIISPQDLTTDVVNGCVIWQ